MCHIIFILPFASLLLFNFLPFEEALPLFVIINALLLFLYYEIYKVMKRRPENGKAAMIGKEGVVVQEIASEGRVLIGNELWFAVSDDNLKPGEKCIVVGFEGLRARVQSTDHVSNPSTLTTNDVLS